MVYLGSEGYVKIDIDLESHEVVGLKSGNFAVVLLNHEIYVWAYLVFKSFRHVDPKSWYVAVLWNHVKIYSAIRSGTSQHRQKFWNLGKVVQSLSGCLRQCSWVSVFQAPVCIVLGVRVDLCKFLDAYVDHFIVSGVRVDLFIVLGVRVDRIILFGVQVGLSIVVIAQQHLFIVYRV